MLGSNHESDAKFEISDPRNPDFDLFFDIFPFKILKFPSSPSSEEKLFHPERNYRPFYLKILVHPVLIRLCVQKTG